MSLPSGKEITSHVSARYTEWMPFIRERFSLPHLRIKTSFVAKSIRNEGLGGFVFKEQIGKVRLNVYSLMKYEVHGYNEYKNLGKKTGISSFKTSCWREYLDALYLHEIAHVIQYALYYSTDSEKHAIFRGHSEFGKLDRPHGSVFQKVYRILRDKFLNDRIKGREHYGSLISFPDYMMSMLEKNLEAAEARKKAVAESPFAKLTIVIPGYRHPFKVVDYQPRKYKYPYIVEALDGSKKRYKLSKMQFEAYKST